MNNSLPLSVIASMSYAWNHNKGCTAALYVIKVLFSNLIKTYTVTTKDAVNCYINHKAHRNTFFMKEFMKESWFKVKIQKIDVDLKEEEAKSLVSSTKEEDIKPPTSLNKNEEVKSLANPTTKAELKSPVSSTKKTELKPPVSSTKEKDVKPSTKEGVTLIYDITDKDSQNHEKPVNSNNDELVKAFQDNDNEKVKQLIESGVTFVAKSIMDPDTNTMVEYNVLYYVIKFMYSDVGMIKRLIEFDGNNSALYKLCGKITPLHLIVLQGNVTLIHLLNTMFPLDLEVKCKYSQTLLCRAVKWDNSNDMIFWLIDNDAKINATDPDNETLLHIAIHTENIKLIEKLLQKGADVNIKNNDEITPYELAIKHKNKNVRACFLLDV